MPTTMSSAPQLLAKQRPKHTVRSWVILLVLLAVLVFGYLNLQAIGDWIRLRGYSPSPAVAALATDDTFTPAAEHLYLINRPVILPKAQFIPHCNQHQEQTIVLGCYRGYERGIYVLQIAADSRLGGVEQVTAAHEMLHASYDRLSSQERKKVDSMLLDYYHNGLTDDRIKATITAYKQSEPDAVVNEMHSVFGTEVAQLPAPLELYYQRYFTNRQKITTYAAGYEAEFTSRQQQVSADDARLSSLKQLIRANEANLDSQGTALRAQSAELSQLRNSGQTDAYNAQVSSYNNAVNTYNDLVETTKAQIVQYNQLVDERNALAVERQQLTNELSGNSVSTFPSQ